jgi:hypothetical protein
LSEERLVLFSLGEVTQRHLFAAARSMVDEEQYGPAVVIAQAAVEIGMGRAISYGLSAGKASDALQTWIEKSTVGTWTPANKRVQRLWQALTEDAVTAADGWEAYKVGLSLRHGFVHRAKDVPEDGAKQFIDAAEKIVAHIAHVMATVTLKAARPS